MYIVPKFSNGLSMLYQSLESKVHVLKLTVKRQVAKESSKEVHDVHDQN